MATEAVNLPPASDEGQHLQGPLLPALAPGGGAQHRPDGGAVGRSVGARGAGLVQEAEQFRYEGVT